MTPPFPFVFPPLLLLLFLSLHPLLLNGDAGDCNPGDYPLQHKYLGSKNLKQYLAKIQEDCVRWKGTLHINSPALEEFRVPRLRHADKILIDTESKALVIADFSELISVNQLVVDAPRMLELIRLPKLAYAESILVRRVPRLPGFSLPALLRVGTLKVTTNNRLTDMCLMNATNVTGSLTVDDNAEGHFCFVRNGALSFPVVKSMVQPDTRPSCPRACPSFEPIDRSSQFTIWYVMLGAAALYVLCTLDCDRCKSNPHCFVGGRQKYLV